MGDSVPKPLLDLSDVVDVIIDNALAVLQHPRSVEVLTRMGMEAVKSWKEKAIPVVHQGRTVDDMETALRRFLGKLHNEQFYPIQLLNTKTKWPNGKGQTWAVFDPKPCHNSIDGVPRDIPRFLRRWDPRDAGTIIINLLVSTSWSW